MLVIKQPLPLALAALLLQGEAFANDLMIPAGFEELVRGQTLWLDVMILGQSVGLYQAQVNLETVQFLNPDDLMAAIKQRYNVGEEHAQVVLAGIAKPLNRNGHLACSTNGRTPGCDYIATETVAIIYDENNTRLKLFLASQYVPQQRTPQDNYYQVAPDSRNALVHQQNINFSADDNFQSASLRGNGALGVTENSYVNVDWNWRGQRYGSDSQQNIDVSNAFYRHDLAKRHYVQGGIMDSRDIFSNAGGNINLSQLPISRIRGVRAGSTLSWLNQDTQPRGTPVPVLLSQDARIDAYRDDKLLASFYLAAGSHELNTRSFPSGSYPVTLRIFENNQLVRTELVPYTHIGDASSTSTQWFVQAGELDDTSVKGNNDNRQIAQAGGRIPLSPSLGITAGSAVLSNTQYWESAVDWRHGFNTGPIDGVLSSKASYLYGNDGSRGNIQQLNYNDGFSLSFYRSQLASSDCSNQAQSRYSFTGCYTSTSAMLSVPLAQWWSRVSYTRSSNQGRYLLRSQLPEHDSDRDAGAPWEAIFVTRSHSETWQAGLNRVFNLSGTQLNTSVNAFVRNNSGVDKKDQGAFFTVSVSRAGRSAQSTTRTHSTYGANGQTSRHGRDQLGYNASYSRYAPDGLINEMGGALSGINTDNLTGSAWGNSSGRFGDGSLNLTQNWDNQQNRNTTSASGNYNSTLLLDRRGIALGPWGNGTPSSAVTVAFDENEAPSSARVAAALSSGSQAEFGSTGKVLLTLPGYQQTTLNLREAANSESGASSEISQGAGMQPLFLPPGRVLHHPVAVSARYTWLGTLTDAQQRPLDGVMPLNAVSWTAFPDGGFMLETDRPIDTLYAIKEGALWQCRLEVKTRRDVVRYVGPTRCESIALGQLPASEQKQATQRLASTND